MSELKPKRKLRNIDFSGKESHLALVHKDQGGPASGADYKLVLKASNFTDEHVEKASKIKVTMEIVDFLQRFYGLYHEDAEVLAQALGYDTEREEGGEIESYEDYITSKVQSIEVIKALYEAEKLSDVLSSLDPDEYLVMLEDQLLLEKAFRKIDKQEQNKSAVADKESEVVAKAAKSGDSTHASVEKIEASASVITKNKESNMTKEVKVQNTEIEKSATELSLELLQKSFDESKVELQKAQELIAEFKKEKQELINKSKTAQFAAVIKDEKLQAPIVKAALALDSQEDFDALLAAVTEMQTSIEKQKETLEKSALFKEQGASVSEDEKPAESAVARILKAKQAKQ